jgi:pyruvate/2-oxoglutarate dehydrogenase complex dihydrolipoamide dehydrogenase (E3) component
MDPTDPFDETLKQNVRPRHWPTPTPVDRYNLVVIGAGAAGLVTAVGAAGLGAKVALIERNFLGGDCLNSGCVPSKALIKSSRVVSGVQGARQFGVRISGRPTVDFPTAMRRMRRLRSEISSNDAAERFRNLGIDVFFGQGQFLDSETIEVSGQKLRFAKAVIATGARAAAPPIPGLDSVPYLTNETLFSLEECPPRMAVIGAGPIGCEMAQTFARFGSRVFLVESMHGILPGRILTPRGVCAIP